jgi:hypothetical protein
MPLLLACGPRDEPDAVSPTPLLHDVRFVEMARPPRALAVVADLAVFHGRLYLATAVNPLGAFGARVVSTTDGASYRVDLDRPFSQGFLRLRVLRDALYVPDADPQGLAPGRLYVSRDGAHFDELALDDAVHGFDAIERRGVLFTSNGMLDGRGALLREPAAGNGSWQVVARADVGRLKFMVEHQGDLLVAKRKMGSPVDYFRFSGEPGDGAPPRAVDAVPGEMNTWRWYVTGRGRLFWSTGDEQHGFQLLWSDGGDRWHPVEELAKELVSGLAELDGNLYALTPRGLFGSRDQRHFELVAPAPSDAFAPIRVANEVVNADACASLTAYKGRLWAGASYGGRLFRVE